jgi:hypothetical protein
MGLPEEGEFYPPLPSGALIPARGFGLEAGAHVYLGRRLGPARLGVGASFAYIRGATDDTSASARLLAPQLSFNFGTSEGWSYLSGGAGVADITGRVSGMEEAEVTATRSGFVLDLNVGGGARWFITRHVAVGFDLRLHRLGSGRAEEGVAGTPSTMLLLASAGLSLK